MASVGAKSSYVISCLSPFNRVLGSKIHVCLNPRHVPPLDTGLTYGRNSINTRSELDREPCLQGTRPSLARPAPSRWLLRGPLRPPLPGCEAPSCKIEICSWVKGFLPPSVCSGSAAAEIAEDRPRHRVPGFISMTTDLNTLIADLNTSSMLNPGV